MDAPKVGVGVILLREGKALFGWRKAMHGSGTWCPPGGHLEAGESFGDCARRELLEETGLTAKNFRIGGVTNDIFEEDGKHYITVNMLCDWDGGEPRAMEPHKAERWEWFPWDSLPEPLFLTVRNLLKQGFDPRNR